MPIGFSGVLERLASWSGLSLVKSECLRPTAVTARIRRVKKMSLAQATANLPSLVNEARQHRRRTLIVEHGRAVAAIVPIDEDVETRQHLTDEEIDALLGALGSASGAGSAVNELIGSRR